MAIITRPLAQKLCQYVSFNEAEIEVLDQLQDCPLSAERHHELLTEGDDDKTCYVVLEGWAACYKLLPDGRRQVVNFMIPGDFLGLRSVLLQVSDHSVIALTNLKVSSFSLERLRDIISEQPRIATAIFWSLSRDEAIIVEHLVNVGRRNALERLAHFIIELGERLKLVGLGDNSSYHCPLRQEDFADALGLTAIHINRSFRQLRERQLATLSRRAITIHDRQGLIELAQFNNFYLNPDASSD